MIYRRALKPLLDRALAAAGLLVLAPAIAALAIAIRLKMGKPVVFQQTRIGLNDAPFRFLKFRTMTDQLGADGNLLPDERRLTRFGAFLRSTSLDELPQLWNVLRGEMSLIGPRPLLPQYLPRYSPVQRRRHEVKPGITGLAQVKGRNTLSWEDKFALDVLYVETVSAHTDLQILGLTLIAVLDRRGIRHAGYATAPEFLGSLGNGAGRKG